jgi:hypothetical protein
MSQKLSELTGGLPPLTFRNVARNRDSGAAELAR